MITSEGTCRLEMPRSESTIASRGPSARPVSTAALIASPSGRSAVAASSAPSPSLGEMPAPESCSPYCSNSVGKKACTAWPKMIGSETFIIVALRWSENSTSSALARAICSVRKRRSAATSMKVASTTSPASTFTSSLSTVVGAVGRHVLDAEGVVAVDHDRLLVGAEVVLAHGRDGRPRVAGPRTHAVRVVPRVALDGRGRAAVGVALAQHRVDRRALDLVVAGAGLALVVGLRVLGVVGQVVALLLQLLDRRLELRDRGGDVGQLDDVRLGPRGQLAQLGEGVVDPLLLGEPVRELRDDPARERDVAGLDAHAGLRGVRLDDRHERVRRQQRRLVGERVDDPGAGGGFCVGHASETIVLRRRG